MEACLQISFMGTKYLLLDLLQTEFPLNLCLRAQETNSSKRWALKRENGILPKNGMR